MFAIGLWLLSACCLVLEFKEVAITECLDSGVGLCKDTNGPEGFPSQHVLGTITSKAVIGSHDMLQVRADPAH